MKKTYIDKELLGKGSEKKNRNHILAARWEHILSEVNRISYKKKKEDKEIKSFLKTIQENMEYFVQVDGSS